MKHTECEDCKLRNGDCGHHFKMNGKTNYDIPSLSACDRYGDCMFFQQKEKPQGDLISRKFVNELVCAEFVDLQDGTEEWRSYVNDTCESILEKIDNAPTVEPICNQIAWEQGYEAGLAQGKSERPQGEWKYTTHYARRYRVCPICTAEKEDDRSAGWNFCWHCGADMRKGGAE